MTYILQNFLVQAQLEIMLAVLEIGSESWSLQPKAGDLASMPVFGILLTLVGFQLMIADLNRL